MKYLSVVFLITNTVTKVGNESWFILLPKQAPGKKMPGIRNGFGGKCEFIQEENRIESTLECARRELKEESGLDFTEDKFIKVGNVCTGDKSIDFYVLTVENMIKIADSEEIVDAKWFNISQPETFLNDMLSGDHAVIGEIIKYIKNPLDYREFFIDKSDDQKLRIQTKDLFK